MVWPICRPPGSGFTGRPDDLLHLMLQQKVQQRAFMLHLMLRGKYLIYRYILKFQAFARPLWANARYPALLPRAFWP